MRRRASADRDLAEELRAHLDLLVDEQVRAGIPAANARRAALLEMGGVTQVAEAVRDVRRSAWFTELAQDTRYALSPCLASWPRTVECPARTRMVRRGHHPSWSSAMRTGSAASVELQCGRTRHHCR